MKKSEIEKVAGGYEVILYLEEKTSEGYPLIQRFVENSLEAAFEAIRRHYGEDITNIGAKKSSAGIDKKPLSGKNGNLKD